MTQALSYSAILLDFIEPLLGENETEQSCLAKAQMGQLAWNYRISEENKLPLQEELRSKFNHMMERLPETKPVLDFLLMRKAIHFAKHQQFIFKIEFRKKSDGSTTLYAESTPVEKMLS